MKESKKIARFVKEETWKFGNGVMLRKFITRKKINVQNYLHRQVIWTLLIANLKARKVGVLDGKAICLLKVLYN